MPLVRISLRRGKSAAHLAALRNGIYEAMRDAAAISLLARLHTEPPGANRQLYRVGHVSCQATP